MYKAYICLAPINLDALRVYPRILGKKYETGFDLAFSCHQSWTPSLRTCLYSRYAGSRKASVTDFY